VAFFGLCALLGYPLINITKSKILLVFFYPLNACANPYLYALMTAPYRHDLYQMVSKLVWQSHFQLISAWSPVITGVDFARQKHGNTQIEKGPATDRCRYCLKRTSLARLWCISVATTTVRMEVMATAQTPTCSSIYTILEILCSYCT